MPKLLTHRNYEIILRCWTFFITQKQMIHMICKCFSQAMNCHSNGCVAVSQCGFNVHFPNEPSGMLWAVRYLRYEVAIQIFWPYF